MSLSVFQILELIVMEGACVHLTLGGAENDRPLFCGLEGGNSRLCSSATAGRVPPLVEGLSDNLQVHNCGLLPAG